MAVIATYSVKGGVGKTTAAVNLAWEAAQTPANAHGKQGKHNRAAQRVLVWDLDPQGSATWLLQAKPKLKGSAEALVQGKTDPRKAIRHTAFGGIDVLPADNSYRDLEIALRDAKKSRQRIEKVLEPITKAYDTVILDVPPGSSLLAENVLRAADVVAVPIVPGALSRRSLDQVKELLSETSDAPRILAFLSMLDRRKAAHKEVLAAISGDPDISDVTIPYSAVIERVGERRAPIATFAPHSVAAQQYNALWLALWQAISAKA